MTVKHRAHDIVKELEAISPAVANLPNTMPFSLPDLYFEALPELILNRLRAGENVDEELGRLSPLLQKLPKTNPFDLPEAFFDQARIPENRASDIAPVLSIQPSQSVDHKELPGSASLIPMKSGGKAWRRLAVAAILTAVIGGSAYFFTRSSVLDDEISTPLAQETAKDDSLALSEVALNSFLDELAGLPENPLEEVDSINSTDLAVLDFSTQRIQEMLQDIPDSELEKYVDGNADPTTPETLN